MASAPKHLNRSNNNHIYCQTTRGELKLESYNLTWICTNAVYSNSSVDIFEVFQEPNHFMRGIVEAQQSSLLHLT
jgi:hypothetical protein